MRKRDKLYKRMKRSGRPNDTKKFLEYKHLVRRVTDKAYERYLGDILGINTTTEQEENSPPKLNTKKMCSLLKHSKQDSSGVAPFTGIVCLGHLISHNRQRGSFHPTSMISDFLPY